MGVLLLALAGQVLLAAPTTHPPQSSLTPSGLPFLLFPLLYHLHLLFWAGSSSSPLFFPFWAASRLSHFARASGCLRPPTSPMARIVKRPRLLAHSRQFYERRRQAFFGKRAATPFGGEGPGLIYVVASFKKSDGAAFRSSNDAQRFLAQLKIKGGLTQKHRIGHRRAEYVRCEQRKEHVWICAYKVSRRFYCERLLHLTLLCNGAKRDNPRCECGVCHREFFDFLSVGGFLQLHATMVQVLQYMGEQIRMLFFAQSAATQDLFDLILRT
ncbi:hypothetical protein K438DRAFT_229942 [Mycena galopus ATCC 62051]|nr:hypothetical protein K438DRAFT_229942 [Mycena galopus ATCC 62051]